MKVYTLIDITETKKHRNNSDNKVAIDQQANFMTFVQTLMLRKNIYFEAPKVEKITQAKLKSLGFGADYTGSHNVWCLECSVDEGQTLPDPKDILSDFELVPVIPGLNETIEINNNVFKTKGKTKNITIKLNDD